MKIKKVFQLLSKLEDKGRRNREKARSILFPKSNFNEANCVNLWFESEETKKEEAECDEIYRSCMAGEKIGDKPFSRVGSWARWTVACEDRNRASVYTFTNLEFMQKKDTWLPEACNADGSTAQERYENLPTGWDADSPHTRRGYGQYNPDNYPDACIAAASNYCRNPDKTEGPW